MLSKLLAYLGNPTDVRSLAAIVLGILVTVVGHQSQVVTAVVDGVAGLIVTVDTYGSHVVTAVASKASTTTATASDPHAVMKAVSDVLAKAAADTAPKV